MLGGQRRWTVLATVLCVVGAVLRILAYAEHRTLWFDEAGLALNIVKRGFIALLNPLDELQGAPPLFLWLSRAAVLVGGENEWSLRALPLLAGIACAPLMWRVARDILDPIPSLLAVGLIAVSPTLVHYAAEAKPYGVDPFVTLVMLDRALAVSRSPTNRGAWWWLGIAGVVALVASTPAPFVLAGVGAFLLTESLAHRDWRRARTTLALGAAWVVVMLILIATVFRPLIGGQSELGRFMQWAWEVYFLTPGSPALAARASAIVWSLLTDVFLAGAAPPGATTVLLAMLVLGVVSLLLARRFAAVMLVVVPGLCIVVASSLRIYPLAQRLALFLVPMLALGVAASLLVSTRLGRWGNWLAGAAASALLLISLRGAVQQLGRSSGKQEARELVRTAAVMHTNGLPVWLSGGASPAWRFYTRTRTMVRPPRQNDFQMSGGVISDGVVVGAWYATAAERIGTVADDTVALSRPSVWSETEAARIRDLARPCGVVLLTFIRPGETQALLASVTALGARVVERREGDDAELYRVCFDRG